MDPPVTTPDTGSTQHEGDGSPATVTAEAPAANELPESSDNPESLLAKPAVPNKKLCGICNEKEAKYKCTRCALPFCSIACSTIHKADHPATETKPAPPPAQPKAEVETHSNGSGPKAGTVAAAGFKGPFAALDESEELKTLFKQYPRLPTLLDQINSSTLPPAVNSAQDGEFRGAPRRREEPWNLDLGLRKGVEALTRARNSDGSDGESLREYSKLVLQILSGENAESVANLIQKELAEENARIIERLLQGET